MKDVFFILAVILYVGCESSNQLVDPRLGEEIQLKLGETVTLERGDISITFKSLEEDSRCPHGAICIWIGNAKVLLQVLQSEIALNTTLEPREIKMGDYLIQLLEVNPYPIVDVEYKPENYSIKIMISKK